MFIESMSGFGRASNQPPLARHYWKEQEMKATEVQFARALKDCLLVSMLIVAFFVTVAPKAAFAADESPWNRWSISPYASSLVEACRKAPAAIDGFKNLPSAVKTGFKQILNATDCKGGTEVWLTPHQLLEEMWSGGASPHVMSKKTVGELPVLKSPDGRSYRKGSVAETAKAMSWTFVHEGKSYVLYLPYVCFNWSWAFGSPPVQAAEECVEYAFNAVPVGAKVHWGVGSARGPLPPSACNAQKQGNGEWTAWTGECSKVMQVVRDGKVITLPECTADIDFIRKTIGMKATVPHRFTYEATDVKQTLRFPKIVRDDVIYLCLEYPDRSSTCGIYMRPQDWKGRSRIDVPDSLWRKNDGKCPS